MARHSAAMQADTPPESMHMLDAAALAAPTIRFFVLRDAGSPVAMAAIKRHDDTLGEIKSMHVLAETRGRGLARLLLERLMAEARDWGLSRLSLETGAQPSFAPARRLYEAAGFVDCPPFAGYRPDPLSQFMTRAL
ncbi:GNAT family N-acetyltransferase [Frigidibacter sp. MR17.24]